MIHFEKLGLIKELLTAVSSEGYEAPTAIQRQAIPFALEGRDILGCAQTGTGKTAAFALPILQRLFAKKPLPNTKRPIRALVITPTRELAQQISDSFAAYGAHTHLRHVVVYGGVSQSPQAKALKAGVDILVATPGRLLDLMGQNLISLKEVETFVLDEADRMLDMGFIDDIRRVISHLPRQRQTFFFSATLPAKILALADGILTNPVAINVTPESPAAELVDHWVYFVEKMHKAPLLVHLLENPQISRALVFTRTKRNADRVTRHLKGAGINADAIHADKTQNARQKALDNFKIGRTRVLVASDIAARGIDVDSISHVINYDMPNDAETYVHRIGRTGRAGLTGKAFSFCAFEERGQLDEVEKLIRLQLQTAEMHPFPSPTPIKRSLAPKETVRCAWRRADRRGRGRR